MQKLGAYAGYTIDGESAGNMENETFSADGAKLIIHGVVLLYISFPLPHGQVYLHSCDLIVPLMCQFAHFVRLAATGQI